MQWIKEDQMEDPKHRCGALVTYLNGPGGSGQCAHIAKYVRTGLPVCGKHAKAKRIVWFVPNKKSLPNNLKRG
jgi:hypothetical protein